MNLPPTLDRPEAEFSGFAQGDGLLTPPDFVSMIGILLPIALFVVVSTPSLQLFCRIRKCQEPMLVQTLRPEASIEGEEGSGNSPGDCFPRRKMKALSVGFPGREKSRITPRR